MNHEIVRPSRQKVSQCFGRIEEFGIKDFCGSRLTETAQLGRELEEELLC